MKLLRNSEKRYYFLWLASKQYISLFNILILKISLELEKNVIVYDYRFLSK